MKKLSSTYHRTAIRATKSLFLGVSADGTRSPRFSSAKEPKKEFLHHFFHLLKFLKNKKKVLPMLLL